MQGDSPAADLPDELVEQLLNLLRVAQLIPGVTALEVRMVNGKWSKGYLHMGPMGQDDVTALARAVGVLRG